MEVDDTYIKCRHPDFKFCNSDLLEQRRKLWIAKSQEYYIDATAKRFKSRWTKERGTQTDVILQTEGVE